MNQKTGNRILLTVAAALSMSAGLAGANPSRTNPSIDILGLSFHPESRLVTLRWTSQSDRSYIIEETTDLEKPWIRNLAGIEGGHAETSYTILPIQDQGKSRVMFFRVLEMPRESLEPENTDPTDESLRELQAAPVRSSSSSIVRANQERTLRTAGSSPRKTGSPKQQPVFIPQPNFAVA